MASREDRRVGEERPRPPLTPPWDRRRGLLVGTAVVLGVLTVVSMPIADLSVTRLVQGASDMAALLDRMLPPVFVEPGDTARLVIETFFIAFAGTVLAAVLSVPLAVLAASNTTLNGPVRNVARGVVTVCRAIPDLVFALIFVRALGIGLLPGILALGLHSIGMLGKLYADAIEEIDEGPREAVASGGAGRLQVLVTGVLPQVMPSIIGRFLYRLDINVRLSTVLGFVGAGGIGQLLRTYLGNLRYSEALGIALLIFVLIVAVEALSSAVRRSLLGGEDAGPRRRWTPGRRAGVAGPVGISPPWTRERVVRAAYGALFVVGLVASAFVTGVNPIDILVAVPELLAITLRFFPPDFTTVGGALFEAMLETVAIGFVATLLGALLSVPIAFFAARNVAPARWVYLGARYLIVAIRGVPELILAVIFVAAVGLGPFPGVIALSIGTIGFLAKLLSDAIEEIDQGPRDAVDATGATRTQQTFTAVVPQVMPALVGNILYTLDINIRTSVILGIVGAGGVGFLLIQSTRTLNFEVTAAILLLTFAVVFAIEQLSAWVRRQLL